MRACTCQMPDTQRRKEGVHFVGIHDIHTIQGSQCCAPAHNYRSIRMAMMLVPVLILSSLSLPLPLCINAQPVCQTWRRGDTS